MHLTTKQKFAIKRSIRAMPLAALAKHVDASEEDILDYLKKRWRPEKYAAFVAARHADDFPEERFSLRQFVRKNIAAIAVLTALVFVSYLNGLGNDFASDDLGAIANNKELGTLRYALAHPQHFLNATAYAACDMAPQCFRIRNIFFHLGAVLTAFALLNVLWRRKDAPFFAAALFAVHPLLTESVTWISGLPYVFYGFLLLLSFLLYILSRDNRRLFFFSIVVFALALFVSEKAIVLPLILFLYEIVYGKNALPWKRLIPYIGLGAIRGILLLANIGERVRSLEQDYYQQPDIANPLVQIPFALTKYLELMLWPAGLTLYHTELSVGQGEYVFRLVFFLLFIGVLIYAYKKHKDIFFWLAFFVITLLPTLLPLGVAWVVAERYAYLGTLGVMAGAALIVARLHAHTRLTLAIPIVIALIVIALSARTIIRNADWSTQDSLWFATAEVSPEGHVIHNNLGDVYVRRGDLDTAVKEFLTAIEIKPSYADAHHNVANVYNEMGRTDDALAHYRTALELNPRLWQSHQNIARIYFDAGRIEEAREEIKKALDINPRDENLLQNLNVITERLQNSL